MTDLQKDDYFFKFAHYIKFFMYERKFIFGIDFHHVWHNRLFIT